MEEIAAALKHLQNHGIPGSGKLCHSPMAYLSTAMDQVIAIVAEEVARTKKTEVEQEQRAQVDRQSQNELDAYDKAYEELAIEFEKAYPSIEAQRSYIYKFSMLYPYMDLEGPLLRSMAIKAWASQRSIEASVQARIETFVQGSSVSQEVGNE